MKVFCTYVLITILGSYLLVSRPVPTCFVYRGGAQSNHETQETYVAKRVIWGDFRSCSYVDTDPAAEGTPI